MLSYICVLCIIFVTQSSVCMEILWRRWASVLAELRSDVVFCVCVCVLYIVAEVGECFSGVEVRCCVLCLCFVHCGGGGRVF